MLFVGGVASGDTQIGQDARTRNLWLYQLESFEVAREYHDNQDAFNDNATNYRSEIFDDLASLLNYCRKEFGVSASDFMKNDATNYP